MPSMTKQRFEELFREEVLPHVVARYQQDGIPDRPARRAAWNDAVDAYIRDRLLPKAAGNWAHPRWLETHQPPCTAHHATMRKPRKKTGRELDRDIIEVLGGYKVDLGHGGQLVRERIHLTTPGDYGADPLGDGTFRMVPSGDVVDFAERTRRLDEYTRRARR